jgi:hypothetical protein
MSARPRCGRLRVRHKRLFRSAGSPAPRRASPTAPRKVHVVIKGFWKLH